MYMFSGFAHAADPFLLMLGIAWKQRWSWWLLGGVRMSTRGYFELLGGTSSHVCFDFSFILGPCRLHFRGVGHPSAAFWLSGFQG